MSERELPVEVWMRKSDGQLGECIIGTLLGDIWLGAELESGEGFVKNPDVVFFGDYPRWHDVGPEQFENLGAL